MKTSTYKHLAWAVLATSVACMSGCGPVYTEDRWYARDYYAHPAATTYAAPQQQVAVQAGIAPDPQFTDLSPYGQWEMTGEYGRIWVPYANRTPGWRPYFYGQWQYTDWGWSWVSDEAWGAGPYHYGRWTWLNGRSWVWIPDYTWGPAWVTWSHGGGCVGWAPMGPGGATWGDIHAHSTYWTYVPTGQFGSGKVQHVVVSAADVPRIHQQTVVIDNTSQIRGNNGSVVTYSPGPQRDQVAQWTARPVDVRPINQVPQVQPRRIPDNTPPPAGGTNGTATAPPPTRTGPGYTGPGPATQPDPRNSTQVVPPTRQGTVPPITPTTPNPTVPNPGTPDPRNPNVGLPPTRTGPVTPTTPIPPTTRPGTGTPPVTPPPSYTPPTRPGTGTPITEPPTRPGTGTTTVDPPTRPGTGYTGPGPINLPPQPTVPRPTPPPVDRGNYAPAPTRYAPPAYTPPTNTAAPAYNPQPAYRPATPSYNPAPAYNPQPAYRPATPSYNPAPAQRFSPPPSYSPPASRPAAPSAPAPTRRR